MRRTILMARRKHIALVAHDNKKEELLKWAKDNLNLLGKHSLYATGATGQLLKYRLGPNVTLLESGPLGGDQQIGSRISEGADRLCDLFLGPIGSSTPRLRCESALPHHGRVEHSGRVQSRLCRLHHLIATDVGGI